MRESRSYGIIPLNLIENEWHVLLIQHQRGAYWGFPKGHAEPGESPLKTATRELKEETNLSIVKLLVQEGLFTHYQFVWQGELIDKTVVLFLAEVEGNLQLQNEELIDAKWVPLTSVHLHLTYPTDQNLIPMVISLIK